MNIFFDFDGTLIDARLRLYSLFKSLIKECDLSFDAYWEIKRKQLDHKYILKNHYKYTEQQVQDFTDIWMNEVEKENWLKLDEPFEGMTSYLETLSKIADLYLITARQKTDMVMMQISTLGWQQYFKKLLVTNQENEKDIVIRAAVNVTNDDFIVGDTGKDIQAGHALGIRTIGVLSGFRNKDRLLKYNPDFIIDNITKFNFESYLPKK